MQGLDGTVVNETRAALEHDDLDNNFWGVAYIPNRSVFNIELVSSYVCAGPPPDSQLANHLSQGNLTYINYLLGKEIGTVYIDNVVLNSGMNKFPMRATITDLGAVLEALGTDAFCKGDKKGILPLQIRCSEVVNHGQSLPYFANALGAHNQTIEIDIGGTVKKMGLDIPCGGLGGGK